MQYSMKETVLQLVNFESDTVVPGGVAVVAAAMQ